MPTYVYHCEECNNEFEVSRKFSDPPLTQCLEGHEQIRKVFVPAGIIFKGSGWYSKDSKSESASKSSESSGSSNSSNPSDSSGSSSSSSSDESTKGESTKGESTSTSSDSTDKVKSEPKASTTSKSDE